MDIAVKQRILGGVVLVAAAILFLPVVLEGAGVKALQPPAPPTAPTTPTTQDLAPALQQQAQGLAKDISASHGEPTFYPIEPAVAEVSAPAPAPAEASRPADALAEQQLAANQAAEKSAQLKAQAVAEAAEQAKRNNAAAEKAKAVDIKAEQKLAAEKKALAEKAIANKAAAAKLANDKKVAAEKLAAAKAVVAKAPAPAPSADPDPVLPQVWVVQVARLNSQEKANALGEKLRARGYRATVTGAGDSWRVIIGPELDKTVAESVKRRLAEDPQLKLSGWIQPYRP